MRSVLRSALVVLVLAAAALLSGCAAALLTGGAAAGAGAVAYVQGELSQVHAAAFDRTWAASVAAMKQMEFKGVTDKRDSLGGTIEARRADDTAVTVKVERAGPDATRVKVRVGTFGDRPASEAIQARITKNLGGK
jgi:uncharacterized protein YceK